jgi:hypothetical protein
MPISKQKRKKKPMKSAVGYKKAMPKKKKGKMSY